MLRPKALRVGIHTWPGNSPFYLAREIGLYKKKKLDVELLSLEKEEDRIKTELSLFKAGKKRPIKKNSIDKRKLNTKK